jgi:hypothetical protein
MSGSQGESDKRRPQLTLEALLAADCNAPIARTNHVDCISLAECFHAAASEAEKDRNHDTANAYRFIAEVARIHFKPGDKAEPYGPMAVCEGRRTLIPSDLRGPQSDTLAELAPTIRNPGLRARLADVAWLNNRKLSESARLAVESYCEAIELVIARKASFILEEEWGASFSGAELLRRCCQIATATGWKDPEKTRISSLIETLLGKAIDSADAGGLIRMGELAMDYGLANPQSLAKHTTALAADKSLNPFSAQDLWRLAARAYARAGDKSEQQRCLINAAECHVVAAEAAASQGMVAASQLMDAIKALRELPETKERRAYLEAKLREAQQSIRDEMQTITTRIDLSELAGRAIEATRGLTLSRTLLKFANLADSPTPEALHDEVNRTVEQSPLSAIVPTSVYDADGRLVAKSPGMGADESDITIKQIIARNEQTRREIAVFGLIEPARRVLFSEHFVTPYHLAPVVRMSPFVPPDFEEIFAVGLAKFIGGDFLAAAHLLIPQMENSLRYVLRQTSVDPTLLKTDLTQESETLSILLSKRRGALERIFGPAIVSEIENLFDFRGGPNLRHRIAHGMLPADAFSGADVRYGCWFIFRMCCLPLFEHWADVEAYYEGL